MTQTKTQIRPVGNRVLVKRLEEDTVQGGIILPDSAKKKQEAAEVVALGTGKTLKDGSTLPIPVKVGDRILMDKYAGQEVSVDDEDFVILSADDIVAIVES